MADDIWSAAWRAARSVADAAARVGAALGRPVPAWAVRAWAVRRRSAGEPLPPLPDEAPTTAVRGDRLTAVRTLARQLMNQHGLIGWEFRFNANVRRAGVCRYPHAAKPGRIELSRHFVLQNPDAEVRDTLLHEIAHALVGPRHGHDAVWKAKCRQIGARPERCYDGDAVAMPKGRWRAVCPGCGKEFDRHRRPKALTGWHCKACGKDRGPLRWVCGE